jgi:SAM-dependent methyltransferase
VALLVDLLARWRTTLAFKEIATDSRVLDIGCGGGLLLRRAAEKGINALGAAASLKSVAFSSLFGHAMSIQLVSFVRPQDFATQCRMSDTPAYGSTLMSICLSQQASDPCGTSG